MFESHRSLRRSLLSVVLTLSGGAPSLAHAQEQSEAEPASPKPPNPEDVDLSYDGPSELETNAPIEGEGEVIFLTGSAIERRDTTTPMPLTIVDRTTIDASGLASIGEVLQRLPSQSNGTNTQENNGGDGSVRINLRGLGVERTLVLINGRRHVPGGTGANASVDFTAIPINVVERVDVLKDGAAVAYGSDAIAGVVNIITRRRFDGTKASVYAATSSRGDGSVYNLSLVTGANSPRGNVVFSAEYHEQTSVYAGDREFGRFDYRYNWETGEEYTVGSTGVPEGIIIDYYDPADGTQEDFEGNQAWQDLRAEDGACSSGVCFNDPEAGWRDFNGTVTSEIGMGDYYNYMPENYLYMPSRRYNIFSTGIYEFNRRVSGVYEASYTNRQSEERLAPEPLFTITEGVSVSRYNAYNPFDRDFEDVRRRMVELGPRRRSQEVNTFRMVTGLEGKLPDKIPILSRWRWNVAYNYGRTESVNLKQGNLIRSRLAAALGPSYMGDDGEYHCGTENDPGDPNCVPLNLFGGVGTITEAMLDHVSYTGVAKGVNEQRSFTARLAGKLFPLPRGGDVTLALGATHRDEYGAEIPDPRVAAGDTTSNARQLFEGEREVREAYGEVSMFIPGLDMPGMDSLELDAATRVFDYSNFGTKHKWSIRGLWRIMKGLSVRGSLSTAFRAPSVRDAYAPQNYDTANLSDPCDTSQGSLDSATQEQCAAEGVPDGFTDHRSQLVINTGGSLELEPEIADIFTMGVVYEPPYVRNLDLTLSYFHIAVTDIIETDDNAAVILARCYGPEQDRASCDLITRDPRTRLITQLDATATNTGGIETAGLDFDIRYSTAIPSAGQLRFDLAGEWLQKFDVRSPHGYLIRGKGGFDLGMFPAWKLDLTATWSRKPWDGGFNVRYISNIKECLDDDCNSNFESEEAPPRDVGSYVTVDLHGSYTFESPAGTSRFTVGMRNAFDAVPPRIYNGFTARSDPTTYDFLGSYGYARFAQTF